MENEQRIIQLEEEINKLSFEQKNLLYARTFSLGVVGHNFDDVLILLSLVSLTYRQLKKKNKSITPLDILIKITKCNKDEDEVLYQFLQNLSILSLDIDESFDKISSCGLTSSSEIINKIKELIQQWTPF